MTKMRCYRCPSCQGTFDFLHHPSVEDSPAPRFCPLCGYDTEGEEYGKVITAPHIRKTAVVKAADGVYEAMAEGSEFRAGQAASMLGVGESEMSAMKITDMKDNLREGDEAAAAVMIDSTPVGQMMAANPSRFGFQGGTVDMSQYAAQTTVGPHPHAGIGTVTNIIRPSHTDRVVATMAAGKAG